MINTSICWLITCSVVGTILLKKESIISMRDTKHLLEIELIGIDYFEYVCPTTIVRSCQSLYFMK